MQVEESKPFWVSPEEAARIIEHITHDDLNYSWLMYQKYWEHEKNNANLKTIPGRQWETMCILAFMFNGGRIHGIRSERARRKKHEN